MGNNVFELFFGDNMASIDQMTIEYLDINPEASISILRCSGAMWSALLLFKLPFYVLVLQFPSCWFKTRRIEEVLSQEIGT